MENKKICSVCKIEKSIDSYYRCKECKGGRNSICKLCKQKGLKVNKDHIIHPFNLMWRRPEDLTLQLKRVTKEDYENMWKLLEAIGYDIQGDVHRQLVDKINSKSNTPVKYKKLPKSKQPRWLPNGELNPVFSENKKPPISE